MARIRTIKPEFWDSPSTGAAGPWARLAFIAMWNWADDYGRGTANLKELEGFIFPNDETFQDRDGNTATFRHVVTEVSECFGVVFYTFRGRHFYSIPSWERHQRTERRAGKSRYPSPDDPESEIVDLTCGGTESDGISVTQRRKYRHTVTEAPNFSALGTGEQGNRGTEREAPLAEADELPLSDQDTRSPTARAPSPNGTKKRRRGTRLPDDFTITDDMRSWAQTKAPHVDLGFETEKFVNHWQAASGQNATKLDWSAAWRNWIIRATEYGPPRAASRREEQDRWANVPLS